MGGGDLTVKALAAFAGRSRDKIKFRANVRRNQRMGKMIGIGETEHQKFRVGKGELRSLLGGHLYTRN